MNAVEIEEAIRGATATPQISKAGCFSAITFISRYIPEGRPETLYAEHKAIVSAIRARDADRAEKAAKDHIDSSCRIHLHATLEG